ncbi:MAG: SipW-dependent-type signal peptide-containing protein [Eggerthellaceae bacterium]|jgi:predicted ribosomally synthesized peptide with SipW-like signal peptide
MTRTKKLDSEQPKRRIYLIIVLILGIILALFSGATLAYFTDTSTSSVDLGLSAYKPQIVLTETWDPNAGKDYKAGQVMKKVPTIKNTGVESYVRIRIRIVDNDTNERITDTNRLNLILQTLRYDPSNTLGSPDTGRATTTKTAADMASIPHFNTDFTDASASNPAGLYTYEYVANNGLVPTGTSLTLFTTVAIPADYTSDDLALMGNYRIDIWGEAVSSAGITSISTAMSALDTTYPVSSVADPS